MSFMVRLRTGRGVGTRMPHRGRAAYYMKTVNVFVTGGTGYIGRVLIERLLADGRMVRALARPGSERRLPAGCQNVLGDALDGETYRQQIAPSDTFVRLVGVAHPGPGKKQQFHDIDLKSIECAVAAAEFAGIRHFIYVSVAHPAPVMHDFIAVRMQGEELIRRAGLNATVVRPWYVLGPGHRWPLCAGAGLSADAGDPVDARERGTTGPGNPERDGRGAGVCGSRTRGGDQGSWRAGDSQAGEGGPVAHLIPIGPGSAAKSRCRCYSRRAACLRYLAAAKSSPPKHNIIDEGSGVV